MRAEQPQRDLEETEGFRDQDLETPTVLLWTLSKKKKKKKRPQPLRVLGLMALQTGPKIRRSPHLCLLR